MKITEDKIMERAERIQSDMFKSIDTAKELEPNSKAAYNDYVISYLIGKIAILELKLEQKHDVHNCVHNEE